MDKLKWAQTFQWGSVNTNTQQELQIEEPQVSYNYTYIQRCHLNDTTPYCKDNYAIDVRLTKGCNSYMGYVNGQFDLALLDLNETKPNPQLGGPYPKHKEEDGIGCVVTELRKYYP